MVDFINKLIQFPNVNIIVKATQCLYKTENSQILLSEDIKNKNKYCLKIILSQINNAYQLSSINTEIFLLQKMKQEENIVQLIDYTTITQNNYIFYFLLMEYCQYHTLYDLIQENYNNGQILNDSLIYSYIYQIALGIKSIHKNGYCHMDLRPENILFREKNKLVICDFGSATNHFYISKNINSINNSNINNILLEISSKTSLFYRTPEEINIYSEYPMNEKIDIYSLAIILFMMLLSFIPSLNDKYRHFYLMTSKKIKYEIFKEMKSLCNPCFSELFENIAKVEPNSRFNIDEVITFLIAKENQISSCETKFMNEKNMFSEYFDKTLYEYENQELNKNINNISIFVRRLLQGDKNNRYGIISDIPNNSYIDKIIKKINNEPIKIIKFYQTLFNTNVFYYNIFSIKMAYIIHYFIFNFIQDKDDSLNNKIFINKIDIISPKSFDIEEKLQTLINYFNIKINNFFYDKDEIIKNIQINKFILLYCQFIKRKINLLKKHSSLILNDNTLNAIDYNKILSINFILDIYNIFIFIYQLLLSIPFNGNIFIHIFDLIAYLLNKEIVSLGSILFIQIIALLKMNRPVKFLGQFTELILKTSFFFQKLKIFRKQIGSKNDIINFVNSPNPDKKLKELLNYIGNIKFDESFNVNEFFNLDSKIRKTFEYIPIKIVCCKVEIYKYDFQNIKKKLNIKYNEKNNLNDINKKGNEKNINSNNNSDKCSDLNNEMKNLNINLKNSNLIKNNTNKNNLINNKNNSINSNRKISSNSNKNYSSNSNKNNTISNKNNSSNSNKFNCSNKNNSSNSNKNISSNKNSNNSNNEEFTNFNKCFFDNNKENNDEVNSCDNKNQNMVSDISSNLNIFSYLESKIKNIKISETRKSTQIEDGNTQIANPSTRVSSNFPGDSNAISNTIINNIDNNQNLINENNKIIIKNNNINNNIIFENNNNNKKEESKEKIYEMEDVLSFLKYEFSKPIFQFIINQNSIKILNLIGYGGTSQVFLGNYRGTDVAIKKIKVKEINDNYYKEFKNEIVALTMIRHPNLVIFMGTMIDNNNNLCIVTEYCKGGTLFDLLYKKKNIDISWNIRLKILIDISKAMNFLHTNDPQIIHYDLKSLNILMTDDIRNNSDNNNISIKINDFGLSKIIDKEKVEWEQLQGVVGSVQWMAPEVIQNNCINHTKADVYSFGIILWEVCTRIQPYKDMNIMQIINFVCNENGRPDCNLLPLDQMPKGLLELIENCWNTDPNLRPDFSSILFTLNKMESLDL